MKKIFILFLFVILFFYPSLTQKECYASYQTENDLSYNIFYENKKYHFKSNEFEMNLSEVQSDNYHNTKIIKRLQKLNFSDEDIVNYIFPETKYIFEKMKNIIEVDETPDSVLVEPNTCNLIYKEGKKGRCIDRVDFYAQVLNQLLADLEQKEINIKINTIDYKNKPKAKDMFQEKSCFSTNFSSSSYERKNNIKIALKALDGIIVDEGEIFSFNNITGDRNEQTGYMQAKIISNGSFVLGFGGGVCQVSTTLYNACLLSGLEIIESNSHSLPVSYIEPSFDAMVNSGSSDLKVRNNSGGKIIITTSSKNDFCKIKIYGLKNKYKITRQSEKIKIINSGDEEVTNDYEKFGLYDLEVGQQVRVSYPKDGFVSRGYLNYYDRNGKLIKTDLIRENRYNATKGIIVKREK